MTFQDNDSDSVFETEVTEEEVETEFGKFHCTVKGVHRGNHPVIITFHDIGLNYQSCFSPLFSHEDMQEILWHFVVCHVNAPGQHEGASLLSPEYQYPSMDQLSEALPQILDHFRFQTVIGLGCGAGAYILTKLALNHPDMVEGLVLININPRAESLMGSVAHKGHKDKPLTIFLSGKKFTGWAHTLPDSVIDHMFGKKEIQNNPDLIATYRKQIANSVNRSNLAQFIKSYQSRRDLEIGKLVPGTHNNVRTLNCPTLLVVGDSSPAVQAVIGCNSKLSPTKTTLLKMADCGGLPQVSQPGKLTEALKYFIQGMGYMPSARMTRLTGPSSGSGITCDSDRGRSQSAESQSSRTHVYASKERASNNILEQKAASSGSWTELAC